MIRRNFKVIQRLGTGSYGTVFKVKRLTDNNIYALKKVFLPKLNLRGNIYTLLKLISRLIKCFEWS